MSLDLDHLEELTAQRYTLRGDAKTIVLFALVKAVPQLIKELREARAEIERLKQQVTPISVNSPWERVPQCACDPGHGNPPSKQKMLECRLFGGPCSPTYQESQPDGSFIGLLPGTGLVTTSAESVGDKERALFELFRRRYTSHTQTLGVEI